MLLVRPYMERNAVGDLEILYVPGSSKRKPFPSTTTILEKAFFRAQVEYERILPSPMNINKRTDVNSRTARTSSSKQ